MVLVEDDSRVKEVSSGFIARLVMPVGHGVMVCNNDDD